MCRSRVTVFSNCKFPVYHLTKNWYNRHAYILIKFYFPMVFFASCSGVWLLVSGKVYHLMWICCGNLIFSIKIWGKSGLVNEQISIYTPLWKKIEYFFFTSLKTSTKRKCMPNFNAFTYFNLDLLHFLFLVCKFLVLILHIL